MTHLKNDQTDIQKTEQNLELACGPCWGHQQYEQGYRLQKIDPFRGKNDNFLSRFVKRYFN